MISRNQVVKGSADIRRMAEIAPVGATNQTAGVVKLRGRLGSRTRNTRMPEKGQPYSWPPLSGLWPNYKFDNLMCFEAVTSLKAILELVANIKS